MEEYYYQEYPKWVFNPDGRMALVQSAEERASLTGTWHDSPADYGVETCPASTVITETGYMAQGYAAPGHPDVPPPGSPAHPDVPPPGTPTHPVGPSSPGAPSHPTAPPPGPTPHEATEEVARLQSEAEQTRRRRY